MSRVYFHSPSGQAELKGSERAWLSSLAGGIAEQAWDLDGPGDLGRAVQIVSMVPEVPDGAHGANYLHTYMREAMAQDRRNRERIAAGEYGASDWEPHERFIQALRLRLRVEGCEMDVADVRLRSDNIGLNTALVAGSDPVRLAAKIHGWCESHCWVEGPDRAWMANIIDQGLTTGLYREGLWIEPLPGAAKEYVEQGWREVTEHLRARDDEPVVLSYSVCDPFPNETVSGLSDDGYRQLGDDDKWRTCMDWLRAERPWARLAPDTLGEVFFHFPVTVYDLFAPDRDARVRAAAGLDTEKTPALPEKAL